MDDSITSHLRRLCTATTTEVELDSLRSLNIALSLSMNHTDADSIEEEFLTLSKTCLEEDNPYPHYQITSFSFPDGITMTDFVHYLFTRRYGWSEAMPHGRAMKVQRIPGQGSTSHQEGQMKAQLNELLDEFLKWLRCQKLSHDLISSLKYVVSRAADHPVIRKQAFIHILEWFHNKCTVFHQEYFKSSKQLILMGLLDVWSAIRMACALKLYYIAEQFSLMQIEDFFQTLVEVCTAADSLWQAREGAVMGINAIIRRFHWVNFTVDFHSSSGSGLPLKFGNDELEKMPEFISRKLSTVIYHLLADPQLSIREQAIKTFSSYLSRCDREETLSSFKEVIIKLCIGLGLSEDSVCRLYTLSDYGTVQWMDAYLAEGLLGLCIQLVKHISIDNLLADWTLFINTFSLYLLHPASTVRQATSKIVKFLVVKDASNANTLLSTLSSLNYKWLVEEESLSACYLPDNCDQQLPMQVYSSCYKIVNPSITSLHLSDGDFLNVSTTWEWREGRLLAFELIFQFLIKNHWLYTFGASGNSKPEQLGSIAESSLDGKGKMQPQQTYAGASLLSVKGDGARLSPRLQKSLNFKHKQVGNNHRSPPKDDLDKRLTLDHLTTSSLAALVRGDNSSANSNQHKDTGGAHAQPLIALARSCELEARNKPPITPQPLSDGQEGPSTTVDRERFMSKTLIQIFNQTIQCLDSSSWELRRMSHQLMPCLVEVIRWYDMSILVSFWQDHLTAQTCLASYGACLSFFLSLSHASKLIAVLADPPDTWQNITYCKDVAAKIINCMKSEIPVFSPIFVEILCRPTLDKLTVIAMQVLAVSSTFDCPAKDISLTGLGAIIDKLKVLTSVCHPGCRVAVKHSKLDKRTDSPLLIPGCGFLSCNPVDSDQLSICLHHVEKYTASQLLPLMPSCIRHCDYDVLNELLPMLPVFLRSEAVPDSDHRLICETLSVLVNKTKERSVEASTTLLQLKNDCLYELLISIRNQTSENKRNATLDCLSVLLGGGDSSRFILPVLKTICSQHCESAATKSDRKEAESLEILSNDIKESTEVLPSEESDTDEEDHLIGSDHFEPHALYNSASTASGRLSSMSQNSEGGVASTSHCSDDAENWDSWDDEDVESPNSDRVYGEFLQKLHSTLVSQGRLGELSSSTSKLTFKEQQILRDLLQK